MVSDGYRSRMRLFGLFFLVLLTLTGISVAFDFAFIYTAFAGLLAFVFVAVLVVSYIIQEKKLHAMTDETSLSLMGKNFERLLEKSHALTSDYAQEKQCIENLSKSVEDITDSKSVDVAKFDYEIITKLTQVSSLCDKAIAGGDNDGEFPKQLAALELLLRQRKAMS